LPQTLVADNTLSEMPPNWLTILYILIIIKIWRNNKLLIRQYIPCFLVILTLFNGCLSKSKEYLKTIEYDSDIIYADTIEIYKLFANHSLSKEFKPIISNFYIINSDFYNNEINNRYKIFTFFSKEELMEMEKILYFDNIQQYIEERFFDDNILGILFVPIFGLQYLTNEKMVNKNNKLTFSIEMWEQISNPTPALANMAIYLIKIKK
jgi:hypothetical protein